MNWLYAFFAVLEVIYEDWIKQDVRGIRCVRGSSLYKCVGIFVSDSLILNMEFENFQDIS